MKTYKCKAVKIVIMGRKWTNMKFSFENRSKTIQEASANPSTQKEAVNRLGVKPRGTRPAPPVENYVKDTWDEDHLPLSQNIDVTFGHLSSDRQEEIVTEFFEKFSFINKISVVYVTDSANVGYGWVYGYPNGELEVIEEYSGYEGAFGEDVTGMMYDDYGVRLNPEFCW